MWKYVPDPVLQAKRVYFALKSTAGWRAKGWKEAVNQQPAVEPHVASCCVPWVACMSLMPTVFTDKPCVSCASCSANGMHF